MPVGAAHHSVIEESTKGAHEPRLACSSGPQPKHTKGNGVDASGDMTANNFNGLVLSSVDLVGSDEGGVGAV